jgi:hypothetical protein
MWGRLCPPLVRRLQPKAKKICADMWPRLGSDSVPPLRAATSSSFRRHRRPRACPVRCDLLLLLPPPPPSPTTRASSACTPPWRPPLTPPSPASSAYSSGSPASRSSSTTCRASRSPSPPVMEAPPRLSTSTTSAAASRSPRIGLPPPLLGLSLGSVERDSWSWRVARGSSAGEEI